MPNVPQPFVRGRVCNSFRAVWNFCLIFGAFQQKFLKNILTYSSLKSEVFVVWQKFSFYVVFCGGVSVSKLFFLFFVFCFFFVFCLDYRLWAEVSNELGSVHPSFRPSVWKFSWDWLISFF